MSSSSMARSLFHCEIFGVATLHSVKLLLRIPYQISQETFQDSQLGIKWEIFPLLGKTWDKKFLFWDNIRK